MARIPVRQINGVLDALTAAHEAIEHSLALAQATEPTCEQADHLTAAWYAAFGRAQATAYIVANLRWVLAATSTAYVQRCAALLATYRGFAADANAAAHYTGATKRTALAQSRWDAYANGCAAAFADVVQRLETESPQPRDAASQESEASCAL